MDLFHRLNVVHLQIPALRDRTGDILPIANGLLRRFCDSSGLPSKTLSVDTEQSLLSYDFPGNVRQLRNCMERAAVFSGVGGEISPEHLPEEIKNQVSTKLSFANNFSQQIPDEGIDFSTVVSNIERDLLLQTLDKTGGNKMQAAKLLNMKRTTLVEKIKRLEIEDPNNDSVESQNE
jgi:DNA-binding NtrC family response regulator